MWVEVKRTATIYEETYCMSIAQWLDIKERQQTFVLEKLESRDVACLDVSSCSDSKIEAANP